ncbi:MAG: conjugative transfer signal peptidase TraF [bacterium]
MVLLLARSFVFNFASASLPGGIYLLHPPGQPRPHLLLFCLPPSLAAFGRSRGYLGPGTCPGWTAAVLKPVAAIEGDLVEIGPWGVRINGHLIPNSAPRSHDRNGRPLHQAHPSSFTVPPGQFLPLSSFTADSWDGRYWGPLPLSGVRAAATPLFLDEPLPPLELPARP